MSKDRMVQGGITKRGNGLLWDWKEKGEVRELQEDSLNSCVVL